MKAYALVLLLVTSLAFSARAQAPADSLAQPVAPVTVPVAAPAKAPEQRIIFYAASASSVTHTGKAKAVTKDIPCRDIVSFRQDVVRQHPAGLDSTQAFPVQRIAGNTRKRRFSWACADRTFDLDIRRGELVVSFPGSKNRVVYRGRAVLK